MPAAGMTACEIGVAIFVQAVAGPFPKLLHQANPQTCPVQARLANPVLAYVLAASPPLLLASTRSQQRRMAPWQGAAHAVSVAAAVTYARFAVFDVLQWQMGSRPAEVGPLAAAGGSDQTKAFCDLCVSLQACSWTGNHVNAACPLVKVLNEQHMPPSGPCPTWPGTEMLLLLLPLLWSLH